MAEQTMEDSDDEYDHLSELSLSDPDSETEDLDAPQNTPATTPPSSSVHDDMPRDKQKRFACTYDNCSKAFNRPARLEEHLRSHTNDRAFKCPHKGCSKTYLRDSHLKHHVKSAHTKVRDYQCTWDGCDKAFATGTRLKNHLLVHEGHEKFRCRGFADCSQTFRKKETLQRHIVAFHLGAKPFPCPADSCNKAFATAEHLRQHQRVNHDPHRYCCDVCMEKSAHIFTLSQLGHEKLREAAYFATFSEFQVHLREEHPPTCQLCYQAFPSAKLLLQHQEVDHDIFEPGSDMPYVCDVVDCGKRYTHKTHLNDHIKTKHSGTQIIFKCAPDGQNDATVRVNDVDVTFLPYGTQISYPQGTQGYIVSCDKEFSYKSSLVKHLKKSHWENATGVTEQSGKIQTASQPGSSFGGKSMARPALGTDIATSGAMGFGGAMVNQSVYDSEAYGSGMSFEDGTSGKVANWADMRGHDWQGEMQGTNHGTSGGQQGNTQQSTPINYPSQYIDQIIPDSAFPVITHGGFQDLAAVPTTLTGNETLFEGEFRTSDYPELD